jgi:glycosyltransferase involved in cell wall biosynthesis
MRILYLVTRDPWGQSSGRKSVFRTVLRALDRLGHEVELVVFDEPEAGAAAPAPACHWLGRPGPAVAGWRAVLAAIGGRESLNEALYRCKRRRERVCELARKGGFDVVLADMIRTAPYAAATGLPWILDLDDLLSERYRAYAADKGARESLLGYYGRGLPGPLRRLAQAVAGLALSRERGLLERREVYWARRADAVSLVSSAEAERLTARAGRPVTAMPMSVDIPPQPATIAGLARRRAVFVGGLDYQPNLDALRYYCGEVRPALARIGCDVGLDVVGQAERALREELGCDGVGFLGYVDNVMATLSGYTVFVAPLVSGTGIKTKVLEAMAAGLTVVTTPAGIIGLDVRHGEHCLLARSPDEMATHLREAFERPDELEDIGARARRYVADHFSHDVLEARWRALLEGMSVGPGAQGHAA